MLSFLHVVSYLFNIDSVMFIGFNCFIKCIVMVHFQTFILDLELLLFTTILVSEIGELVH